MDAQETTATQETTARQAEWRSNAITTRIGALMLPLAIPVLVATEILHPHREDPMDYRAVFTEYAHSRIWTAVHLGEYFGFLLLLGGLVALFHSASTRPSKGAGAAPFGLAAAVATAASFTVLQAVDGIALKRAVDAWASAPAAQKAAAFAAAEAIRWTEIGMNSLSFFFAGLTLLLAGLAVALGSSYPRWLGVPAVVAGAAFMYDGARVVAFEGFVPSSAKTAGLLLLAIWAFVMAVAMWRRSGRRRVVPTEQVPSGPRPRSVSARWP